MEAAGVGRDYKTMRMTPYHTYFRGSRPCCKSESPTVLVKSRFSGINPDFSNLNFQKRGMELSAHIQPSTPRNSISRQAWETLIPDPISGFSLLYVDFPFVLPELRVNLCFKGQPNLGKAPGNHKKDFIPTGKLVPSLGPCKWGTG